MNPLPRLALEGGAPVRKEPFAPWPAFAEDEIEAASAVLRSGKVNYWTGDQSQEFEREFAAFVGVKYAVALANGTVALEHALYALGIGPGDEVVVSVQDLHRLGELRRARRGDAINAEGIPCTGGACSEIYLEKAVVNAGLGPKQRLPVANRLSDSSLMFMLHPGLTDEDMRDTCTALAKVMRAATT